MLAAPARASPMETKAAAPMAPMAHAGHHMPAPKAPQSPQTPRKHNMPCCPTPMSECAGTGCATPTVVALVPFIGLTSAGAPIVLPVTTVSRWASFVHPPEPPPPRV